MAFSAPTERYRTRAKTPPAPPRLPEAYNVDLAVVAQTAQTRRYLAERAAEEGVAVLGSRQIDPLHRYEGQMAVLPQDTRNGDKPLFYADFTGSVPVAVLGGAVHWQEAREMVDELRHYGQDTIERDEPPVDWDDLWETYRAVRRDVQQGRRVYGAAPHGQMRRWSGGAVY